MSSPDTIIMLAHARQQEMLAEAEMLRLCKSARAFQEPRPPRFAPLVHAIVAQIRGLAGGSRLPQTVEQPMTATSEVPA